MADNLTSGNQGTVGYNASDLCNLASFNLTIDQAVLSAVVSCSSPWQWTARGNKKVTGTITCKWDDTIRAENLFLTDALVALQMRSYSGKYYSGNARIGQISHTCNVETGAIQEVSATFESDGAWTIT